MSNDQTLSLSARVEAIGQQHLTAAQPHRLAQQLRTFGIDEQ